MILGFKPLNSVVATKMQTQPHVCPLFSIRSMAKSTNWFPQSYRYEPKISIKTFELMEHNPYTGCKTEDKGLKRKPYTLSSGFKIIYVCVSPYPSMQIQKNKRQTMSKDVTETKSRPARV